MKNRIFSTDSPKAIKASAFGYLNAIHYMAPADLSGVNLCPHASAGCKALCLGWTAGQAGIVSNLASRRPQGNAARQSRLDKARRFMRDRAGYMRDVVKSIEQAQAKAKRLGKKLCVRMNGSSDIAWEGIACERWIDGVPGLYRSVFADALPASWHGFVVINGDEHDLRHLDPKATEGNPGYVIGLSPKGRKAKKDVSGFVVR